MAEKIPKRPGVLRGGKLIFSGLILFGAFYIYSNYKESPQFATTIMIIAAGLISFIIFKVLRLLLKVIMFLCILAVVFVLMSNHFTPGNDTFKINQTVKQGSNELFQNIKGLFTTTSASK